jgi:hypothetical protein
MKQRGFFRLGKQFVPLRLLFAESNLGGGLSSQTF